MSESWNFSKTIKQLDGIDEVLKPAWRILRIIFVKMRHKIKIEEFNVKLHVGIKNTHGLGVSYGLIWTFVNWLYASFTHYFIMNPPKLEIETSSHENRINFEVQSIISIRIVHIIRAVLHFGLVYFEVIKIIKSIKSRRARGA